jgi:hypothetical protein
MRNQPIDAPAARPDAKPRGDTKSVRISLSPTHHRLLKRAADDAGLPIAAHVKTAAIKAAKDAKSTLK